MLHLAGPVLDLTVFRRGLKLRTDRRSHLDFALVNSSALNDYSRSHDISGLKTTVYYYGYYYGLGGTVSASARLDWKGFRVRGLASYGAWGSIDFLDRFQAEVTNNASLGDTRVRLLAGLGWKVPRLADRGSSPMSKRSGGAGGSRNSAPAAGKRRSTPAWRSPIDREQGGDLVPRAHGDDVAGLRALPPVVIHADEELVRELAREAGDGFGIVVDVGVDRLRPE